MGHFSLMERGNLFSKATAMKNDKGRSPGICFNVDTPDVLAQRGQSRSLFSRIGFERSLKLPPKRISKANPKIYEMANPRHLFLFGCPRNSLQILSIFE